jgi:hypothetical protein
MDTVKQRPAVAANNHRWPAAAASELVTSGHIIRVAALDGSGLHYYSGQLWTKVLSGLI